MSTDNEPGQSKLVLRFEEGVLMARGNWSFLHEWVIYDYLMERQTEGTLRLRHVIANGTPVRRDVWKRVDQLQPIVNTAFPDVEALSFAREPGLRPAEVKFTSSLFEYHDSAQYADRYQLFKQQRGFLIVLSHDYMPTGAETIDVYELDRADFTAYCRENFDRLLNRQIKVHAETKVWVMYQGGNFNRGTKDIPPARHTGRWCPTENLTGLDLALGDRLLFVKTTGASTQAVQKSYLEERIICPHWFLEELYVAEVTTPIQSRWEYSRSSGVDHATQLWATDPWNGASWTRWKRVFGFKHVKTLTRRVSMTELHDHSGTRDLVKAVLEVFCYNKSRELSLREYRDMLEALVL